MQTARQTSVPIDLNDGLQLRRLYARRTAFNAILFTLSLFVCGLLGFAYYEIAWPQTPRSQLSLHHHLQVLVTVLANAIAIVIALMSRGTPPRRVSSSIMYTCLLHGLLIAVQFTFRLYYSRPIVLAGLMASFALVTVVLILVDRFRPVRVGAIADGLSSEYLPWLGAYTTVIPTPETSPRSFDVVLVNWSQLLDQRWNLFVSEAILSGTPVRHLIEYIEDIRGRVSPEHFRPKHAEDVSQHAYKRVFKRVLDLMLCLLALPIALPILAAAALAIRVTMGGPVMFIQQRVGHGGRIFRIYKLRTMVESSGGPSIATGKIDMRITPLGHWLRRYRIDELPQLFNVLRGDMSIVGPRPEQADLTRRYIVAMPAFRYRNLLPPGITGWAQINAGYASDESETREKLMYDLYYIKNASFLLDLRVIATTVRTVLLGRGAR